MVGGIMRFKWIITFWAIIQIILIGGWLITGGWSITGGFLVKHVSSSASTANIGELNGRFQNKSVTVYGKATDVLYGDDDLTFVLVDGNSKVKCRLSLETIAKNKDREQLIFDSQKGKGINVTGVYTQFLMDGKIDIKKVFVH